MAYIEDVKPTIETYWKHDVCFLKEGKIDAKRLEAVVIDLLRQMDNLKEYTTDSVLLQNIKIADLCKYIKDNLETTFIDMVDEMKLTGELDDLIKDIITDINKNVEFFPESVTTFGAIGDGYADDTMAIQKAIDEAGYILIPEGTYNITQLKLKSNTKIIGQKATIKCLALPEVKNNASLIASFTDSVLENVYIEGITFEGEKEIQPNEYLDVIGLFADQREHINNVTIQDCHFKNFREDAIRFMYGRSSTIKHIHVKGCTFDGVDNTEIQTMNAIRFVMTDYLDAMGTTYGVYPVQHVAISECKAIKCRTLCDIKRGCQFVNIDNCSTLDMEDCHNSIDGSKNVIMTNMLCSMSSDFMPRNTLSANFLEIQGEDIIVSNLIADGLDKVRDGVQITDYGHPDENGQGHISNNVLLVNCMIKNVNRNGFNINNGDDIRINGCSIENAGGHSYAFTSGDGRIGTNGSRLKAGMNYLTNSTEKQCLYGVVANNMDADRVFVKVSNTVDETGALRIYHLENYLKPLYMDIGNPVAINRNPYLELTAGNLEDYTYNQAHVSFEQLTDVNLGGLKYLLLKDTSTTYLGEFLCCPAIKVSKDDVITFDLVAKKGTNNYCSVLVKEYNDSTWLANTFVPSLELSANWLKMTGQFRVKNADTNNIRIAIIPSTSYNEPSATGELNVQEFKVYKV